jgi:hypothetical protein
VANATCAAPAYTPAPDPRPALRRPPRLLGVRLDRALDWDELTGILEDAYASVAPPKLVEAARARFSAPG